LFSAPVEGCLADAVSIPFATTCCTIKDASLYLRSLIVALHIYSLNISGRNWPGLCASSKPPRTVIFYIAFHRGNPFPVSCCSWRSIQLQTAGGCQDLTQLPDCAAINLGCSNGPHTAFKVLSIALTQLSNVRFRQGAVSRQIGAKA
jgi:hypothetical protein